MFGTKALSMLYSIIRQQGEIVATVFIYVVVFTASDMHARNIMSFFVHFPPMVQHMEN